VPVTEFLDEAVKKAIRQDAHVSKSDFIRDAVREKLRKMGFGGKGKMSKKDNEHKIKADSTLPGCIGLRKAIPPNICQDCAKHADLTCQDLQKKVPKLEER
jgi:hypothetical protein